MFWAVEAVILTCSSKLVKNNWLLKSGRGRSGIPILDWWRAFSQWDFNNRAGFGRIFLVIKLEAVSVVGGWVEGFISISELVGGALHSVDKVEAFILFLQFSGHIRFH